MAIKIFIPPKIFKLLFKTLPVLLVLVLSISLNGQEPTTDTTPRNTGVQEDINEFLGYEDLLLVRYLSLPYDTVMNTNMASYFVDLGFVLILFLPLIYLISSKISWLNRLGFVLLCMLFLLLSVPSAYLNRMQVPIGDALSVLAQEEVSANAVNSPLVRLAYQLKRPFLEMYANSYQTLNSLSGPTDYLTYPLLFLLLAVFFLMLDQRIRHHNVSTRACIQFLLLYIFLWLILSSGIAWYGLLMIPMVFMFIVVGMVRPGTENNLQQKLIKGVLLTASGIWIITAFAYRLANYDGSSPQAAKYTYMANVAEYQTGRKALENVFDRSFPQYRTALEFLNQEDQSLIYRVGTPFPHFVKKNDRRIFSDNFLDFFKSLNQEFPNKQELANALKAYGFRYIIFDINLSANDHTEVGSLRNKFQLFNNFLYQNPQLRLIATDRILRGADGNPFFAHFKPADATVENRGWFAVYQIL